MGAEKCGIVAEFCVSLRVLVLREVGTGKFLIGCWSG